MRGPFDISHPPQGMNPDLPHVIGFPDRIKELCNLTEIKNYYLRVGSVKSFV